MNTTLIELLLIAILITLIAGVVLIFRQSIDTLNSLQRLYHGIDLRIQSLNTTLTQFESNLIRNTKNLEQIKKHELIEIKKNTSAVHEKLNELESIKFEFEKNNSVQLKTYEQSLEFNIHLRELHKLVQIISQQTNR